MEALLHSAALLCALAGVGCGGLVLLRSGDARLAVGVLLDLLLAAGLLRLAGGAEVQAIVVAAVVVVLRQVLQRAVRLAATRSSGSDEPRLAG